MADGPASRFRLLLAACLAGGVLAACLSCSAETASEEDAVPVRVEGLALDPDADAPIVILIESDGERRLPIWIGETEARSIAAELEELKPIRPNTHDLARRLIEGLDGTVLRIVVTDLREGIYYARIDLDQEGRSVSIDARPSDAIAIGLRLGAPLFVRAQLFESGGLSDGGPGQAIRGRAIERQVPGRRL
jgi:bifunctional DNase/RNase